MAPIILSVLQDALREGPIHSVVDALYSVAATFHMQEPTLATLALSALQRFVCWIDIGLVVNERWLQLLFGVLASSTANVALRGTAADCVTQVVSKRMEATQKLELVQELGVVQLCRPWSSGLPLTQKPEEEELAVKLAKLLSCVTQEVLEAYKKVS